MSKRSLQLSRRLAELKHSYGGDAAAAKLAALREADRVTLADSDQVLELHETLCYWRAYPDDAEVLAETERQLAAFESRKDLRRFRAELADSGVAGTDLWFCFYWLMAIRLLERWPEHVQIEWGDFENVKMLTEILHLLMPYSETPALDSCDWSPREWVERLKSPGETDAAFLMRRFEALQVPRQVREYLYEKLDVPVKIALGEATVARGCEKWGRAPVVWQTRPPERRRPVFRTALKNAKFEVHDLPKRQARELIDLANAAMIPRHRDLLVFLHADVNDVRVIDFGDGLQFACIGTMPDRRLMLESAYGFLTLRNGVPIGYVLASALFNSCELAYNVFETFRGAEAAVNYCRFVAAVSTMFGADSFFIDPYQLGHDNREGQLSGAFWFYYKLGFRPRSARIEKLVRQELARMKKDSKYRSSPERVHELAADGMYLTLGAKRPDVLGRIALGEIGMRISEYLAERFGGDRELGIRTCSEEAGRLLGVKPGKLPRGERLAWDRWGPLVMCLPGVSRWSAKDKRALAEVVRAKGGQRESDFVLACDEHTKLRRALVELTGE